MRLQCHDVDSGLFFLLLLYWLRKRTEVLVADCKLAFLYFFKLNGPMVNPKTFPVPCFWCCRPWSWIKVLVLGLHHANSSFVKTKKTACVSSTSPQTSWFARHQRTADDESGFAPHDKIMPAGTTILLHKSTRVVVCYANVTSSFATAASNATNEAKDVTTRASCWLTAYVLYLSLHLNTGPVKHLRSLHYTERHMIVYLLVLHCLTAI